MRDYSHSSIQVHNRVEQVADILSGEVTPLSDFESQTFSFIRDWIKGVDLFNLQTSGSTGTPKEIRLGRKQLIQSAERTIRALGLDEHDTAFVCLDTKYIAGKMMLARALEGNMKIVVVEPSSDPLKKLTDETQISFAAFVPLQLHEILTHNNSMAKLNRMKAVLVGGGEISMALQQLVNKVSCPIYATYGMTETVSHIALQRLNGAEASDHFTTLPGISVTLDNRGCLVVELPEFTEDIVTNDLVELLSPTQFRWLGRFDLVINSGGFKVSPEKIEKLISAIFANKKINRSFFVCGIPDDRLGQKLILAIEGFPISGEKKILSALKQQLHPYEVPKQVLYIREFLRTETGKINRPLTFNWVLTKGQ